MTEQREMPTWKKVLLGIGGVVLVQLVVSVVAQPKRGQYASAPPPAAMNGIDPVEPIAAPQGVQAGPPRDADFEAARAKLKEEPNDVGLAAAVAHGLLAREELEEAVRVTQRALGLDPFHTEHRVHAEMLRGMKGETAQALDALERIGRAEPDGAEALLFAGGLALELEAPARALGNFEAYRATVPPGESPPRLEQVISQLRAQLKGSAQ